jgi:plastocyanin
MPAWAQSQGGSLSDEQIRQLMTLITQDRWELVKHHVDVTDRVSTALQAPVSGETTSLRVDDVTVFTDEEALRIGDERLRVKAVPTLPSPPPADRSGVITVERGILGTTPLEHAEDATIYRFPEAPEGSFNQASCGQTARPVAPAGTPSTIEDFTGQTVEVIAQNITFNVREISVRTGGQVRARLDNRDTGVEHNIAFYQSSTNLTPVSTGSVGLTYPGPGIDDTVFPAPAAGSYFFRCDVHPTTMIGTFTVTP